MQKQNRKYGKKCSGNNIIITQQQQQPTAE